MRHALGPVVRAWTACVLGPALASGCHGHSDEGDPRCDAVHLEPGQVCVDVDPGVSKGDVYIDGRYSGASTGVAIDVAGGEHEISVLTATDYRRVHVAPTERTILLPTEAQRVPARIWKVLFVAVKEVDTTYTDENFTRTCKGTLSDARADVRVRELQERAATVQQITGGLVQWQLERRVLDAPVHYLSTIEPMSGWTAAGPDLSWNDVWWSLAQSEPDVQEMVSKYDVVVVVWPADGCIGLEDLSKRPPCNAESPSWGSGYFGYITAADVPGAGDWQVCPFLHEWIHTIEEWTARLGSPLPPRGPANDPWPLHQAGRYGYPQAADQGWESDFLMGRIKDGDHFLGVGPDLLTRCTTSDVRAQTPGCDVDAVNTLQP